MAAAPAAREIVPRKTFKDTEVAQFVLRHAARAAVPAASADDALEVFRRRGAAADPYKMRDYISWYDASAAVRGGYPFLVPCARAQDGAVVPLDKRARDAAFAPHVPPAAAAAVDLAARPGTATGLPVDPAGVPLADARYVADCAAAVAATQSVDASDASEAPAVNGPGKGGSGRKRMAVAAEAAEALLRGAAHGPPLAEAPDLPFIYGIPDSTAVNNRRGVAFEWLPLAAPATPAHAAAAADWHAMSLPQSIFYPLPDFADPEAAAAALVPIDSIAVGAFMLESTE